VQAGLQVVLTQAICCLGFLDQQHPMCRKYFQKRASQRANLQELMHSVSTPCLGGRWTCSAWPWPSALLQGGCGASMLCIGGVML
jgi:hypothetical protein